jgi:serine/threonine protein kinase
MSRRSPGDLVHGHRLLALLGEGGDGEVWRADHLGEDVALKLFHGARSGSSLRRELETQVKLGRLPDGEGRWFPRIEQIDLDAEPPYVRMDYLPGQSLEELLRTGDPALEARLDLLEQVLEALAVVHRHDFVHGDLSPRNVRVTPRGEVRLIDAGFGDGAAGTSDPVKSSPASSGAAGVSAPLYAAPERFERGAGPGKPADVFSFGKLLYRTVAGEQPHVVKPLTLKLRTLSPAWDAFLFRCLEERPEDRPADASSLLAEFRRLRRGSAKTPSPETSTRPVPGLPAVEADGEPEPTMVPAVFITFIGYLLFWVPGAILNSAYLSRADDMRRITGTPPFGTGALRVMQALLFWLPLALFSTAVLLTAAVAAALHLAVR